MDVLWAQLLALLPCLQGPWTSTNHGKNNTASTSVPRHSRHLLSFYASRLALNTHSYPLCFLLQKQLQECLLSDDITTIVLRFLGVIGLPTISIAWSTKSAVLSARAQNSAAWSRCLFKKGLLSKLQTNQTVNPQELYDSTTFQSMWLRIGVACQFVWLSTTSIYICM